MAFLTKQLLSDTRALPHSPDTPRSMYEDLMQTASALINSISPPAKEASLTQRAQLAIQACTTIFKQRAIIPEHEDYERARQSNWSSTCWLPAACFVKCQNNKEVAVALKVVKHFECKFAIRGAGHNANPGVSSTGPDGIVIDISALNHIKLSEDKKTVSVGPGATWDQVYSTIEPHELTIVGGRVAGVGVGGLIAGGGMSHFSNAWGMACDHVQSFEVVTPDCEIVTASAYTNTDLFRALKGSSSNFGIITNLTLYTNPEYQIWYTFRVYAASDAAAVMAAAIAVQHGMTRNDKLGFFLMVKPTCFVAGLLYDGHTTTTPSGFAAFDSLTAIAVPVPPTNGTQLSCAQACAMSNKAKRKSGTATVRPDAELYLALQSLLVDIVTKHDVKFDLQFTFQPVHGARVNAVSAASGGNVLGIRDEEQAWLAIMAEWEDEGEDETAEVVMRELIDGIHEEARKKEGLVEWWFMNDATLGQDVFGGYGEEAGRFLREVKGRWDEEGWMGRFQSGGFIVGN